MSQIAYLIESPRVSSIGKLQSKSLRAFEVEYIIDVTNVNWHYVKVTSTGKVFILKDNTIIEKRTKAKLTNKYIRSGVPTSNIIDIPYRHSRLFTSPELALLAKSVAIKSRVQSRVNELEANLADARSSLSYVSATDEFISRYPEHLV